MNSIKLTPTEVLLQVAKSRPFATAIRSGKTEWSYAALWQRVRELANKIDELETSGRPIGIYMGLEVDFVAAAHAVWLSGRTVVYLNSKWTPEVLRVILDRSNAGLILYGDCTFTGVEHIPSVCTFDFVPRQPPSFVGLPSAHESVDRVPLICSVTPTSGSTGVPKSIVYPMRRSLDVLTEESTTLLKPRDGQWLRGGTTFLRPLFELRRFMYTQSTLYLDSATSVAGQCENFANELEDASNTQPLRTHFTPGVFKAFVDYVKLKYGENKSWSRVYWMVIGGENLSPQDLAMAKRIFPEATLACNYGCSEVGFAGVNQHYVRPDEPVPETITFDATQGCDDLVLLNDDMEVVPRTEGASGIIGIVSTQSATRYLGNDEATAHMFRPWGGERMLLYTDDIGHIAKDGRIAIKGRRSRNVKINGLFVDLDFVERALAQAFSPDAPGHGLAAYKLVKSSSEKIIMFWTGESNEMDVLKRVRESLRAQLGDNLAMVVASTRQLQEMPYNASYKVDLAKLQTFADETPAASEAAAFAPASAAKNAVQEVASAIAGEVARLSNAPGPVPTDVPLMLAGLNSITVVQLNFWLQTRYDWDDDMVRLFEDDATAEAIARDIVGEADESAGASDSDDTLVEEAPEVAEIARAVAAQVKRLSRSDEPVPTDVPLMLAGLNSITVVQLHFWLQSTYDYEEDMSRLFEEDVSAEVVARDIVGDAPSSESEDSDSVEARSESGDVSDTDSSEKMEIACAIAKEIGTYCRALGPVPTDVPLVMAGLNSITAVQLYSWLQAVYDYDDEMSRLLDHSVTAEVLAQDILGSSPASSEAPETPQDTIEVVVEVADENIPSISLDEENSPSSASLAEVEVTITSEPEPKSPAPTRRTRLMPKAPLSVKVYPTPEEVPLPEAPMPSSTAKYLTAEAVLDSSMPAAESLSGKKAGLVYGLLALGLLGSPHSPTFHLAQAQQALSPRAPASAHTPVFSPWLDTVRYPAMEAIQSPWVADAPHRSIDSVLFPQSPRVF